MKIQIPLLLAAASVCLVGCGSVNTVENSQKSGYRQVIADKRVITDPSLNRRVHIVAVNTTTTSGGLLQVQIELQNHTSSEQRFLYHFEWFDSNGMQVNNVLSATLPDQIEAGEDKFISGIAPSYDCRDFRVKFIDSN